MVSVLPLRFLLSTVLFLLCQQYLYAQSDTRFWFGAPDISESHENRPISLRITTGDRGAVVKVQIPQPGGVNYLYEGNLGPNSAVTVDLTSYEAILQSKTPNEIDRSALLVEASAPVTCYYEVGYFYNTDIFTLKGNNALGTHFFIPGQTIWDNSAVFADNWSSFQVVATENNTIVEIFPKGRVKGHENDSSYAVFLERGEVYNARAATMALADHLSGSRIRSNRPVAVTFADDGLAHPAGCIDVIADQLVPVEVVGKEYVAIRGSFDDEYMFVTATEDGTVIERDGTVVVSSMDAGEVRRVRFSGSANYVQSNQPIYLLHVSGIGCEPGGALLPSLNCKGSNTIDFTRGSTEEFYLNVLVRSGGESSFLLNGSSLDPASFEVVPGTNGDWMAARLSYTTAQIAVGSANRLINADFSFQVGILDGGPRTGARFGYFSNFSSLYIGDDFSLCEGESRTISAGEGAIAYRWNTGDTVAAITIDSPGTYWAEVTTSSGCTLVDTITVRQIVKDFVNLPDTVRGCDDEGVVIDAGAGFAYLWSDGFQGRYNFATESETLGVDVISRSGCRASDSTVVIMDPGFVLSLPPSNVPLCEGDTLQIDLSEIGADSYLWQDGSTDPVRQITRTGTYSVTASRGVCSKTRSVPYLFETPPTLGLPDTVLCEGEMLELRISLADVALLWSDSTTSESFHTAVAGSYWVEVVQGPCTARDTFSLSFDSLPQPLLPENPFVCPGDTLFVDAGAEAGTTYLWSTGATTAATALRDSGRYELAVTRGACEIVESLYLSYYPVPAQPVLQGPATVCPGLSGIAYTLDPAAAAAYDWWVDGGAFAETSGGIAVDWGGQNAAAGIRVLPYSEEGCPGDTLHYPVRINVQLDTQIPAGNALVCLNQADTITYTTRATEGSVYSWAAGAGTITSGQGTAEVQISWPGTGRYPLYISEQSTTLDTVCFGASDTLFVEVFADSAALDIIRVSYDSSTDSRILIDWTSENPQRLLSPLEVFVRQDLLQQVAPALAGRVIDTAGREVPGYRLRGTNACLQALESPVHQVIHLQGSGDDESKEVLLQWSRYQGWEVAAYEVWRRVDEEQDYMLVERLSGESQQYRYTGGEAGFSHSYRIRAEHSDGRSSWSNSIALDFAHALFVPNVITPNGDGLNDTFTVRSLGVYPDNELRIFNRYGKEVFAQENYANDWAAETPGMYYYELHLTQEGRPVVMKGWLQVLR